MGAKGTDWADREHRKSVVDTRRFLWRDDTVEMHAKWLGLSDGMSMLDLGCGTGYVGRTWWRFCGPGGSYTGVDISAPLLVEGSEKSTDWIPAGRAAFVRADAGSLPFDDGTFDWTVCQTLLMHMEHPEHILAEMIRVTRPGGVVSCNEPDNKVSMTAGGYDSFPEPTIEEDLLCLRVARHWIEGRRRLGLGDWTIGPKVPVMMQRLGLEDVDIRVDDMVGLLQPPYDTPGMQFRMKQIRESIRQGRKLGDDWGRDPAQREFRRLFFAGGGTEHIWRKYFGLRRRQCLERIPELAGQLRCCTYFCCPAACSFFSIRGRKPAG